MSTYAAGFDAGERQAFEHRTQAVRWHMPARLRGEYERGFWAGYLPRTAGWDRAGRVATLEPVCQELERA